jgi:beta-fructofuranosidase
MIATGTANQQDGALGTGSVLKKEWCLLRFIPHNGNLDPKKNYASNVY